MKNDNVNGDNDMAIERQLDTLVDTTFLDRALAGERNGDDQ